MKGGRKRIRIDLHMKFDNESLDGHWEFKFHLDEPNDKWENIIHDRDECVQVLSGTLCVIIGNEEHIISAGEFIIIPAFVSHGSYVAGTESVTLRYGFKRNIFNP